MGSVSAVVYCRVSSVQQEAGSSLDSQLAACLDWCRQRGYAVDPAHIFREVASGIELWQRPKLSALREVVRRRQVGVVCAYAVDRLARDPVHLGVVLSEAQQHGVAVEFVTESFDTSPEGALLRFVRGYTAKVEHSKITERTNRGRRARVEGGKLLPGPRPPFGYRWVKVWRERTRTYDAVRLECDPDTAPIVRMIYRSILAGRSLRTIARGLTESGVPTPTGRPQWWNTTLGHLVKSPVYCGRPRGLRWQSLPTLRGDGMAIRPRPVEEQIVLPSDLAPPLVTPEEWSAVQQRLAQHKRASARNNPNPTDTLLRAGLARCGLCGGPLQVERRRSPQPGVRYRCRRGKDNPGSCRGASIEAAILDAAAWRLARRILTRPEIVAAELARVQADDPTTADLAALDRLAADTTRRQGNAARSLSNLDDAEAGAPLRVELRRLADQARRLADDRAAILARRAGWQQAQARLGEIEAWCRSVGSRLDTLDYAERRTILEALGLRATLHRADRTPRFDVEASIPLGATDADSAQNSSQFSAQPTLVVLRWSA